MATDPPFHSGGIVTGRVAQLGPDLQVLPKTLDFEHVITQQQADRLARIGLPPRRAGKTLAAANAAIQANAIADLNYADLEASVLAMLRDKASVFHAVYGGYPKMLLEDMMNVLPKRGLNGPLDIPLAWKAALREVQKLFPEAALAGGALRDRDHGVKVKDLDIFVRAKDNKIDSVIEAKRLLESEGWKVDLIDSSVYDAWFSTTRIVGILETKFENAPPVSLIFVDFPVDETMLARFDFGLSQIMWDGKHLKKTGAYDADFRMKRFRLVTECNHKQLVRRMERWARLKEKYPNHKLDFGVMSPDGNIGYLADATVRIAHGV